jgi:hypothetical protein
MATVNVWWLVAVVVALTVGAGIGMTGLVLWIGSPPKQKPPTQWVRPRDRQKP